jgi:low affinity Fe/Cu permease
MEPLDRPRKKKAFERFALFISHASGTTPAFIAALLIVLIWLLTGPMFNYSETWQLIINTGTTIITFLMVFLIQKSQNKDSLAIQLKLNELVAAQKYASNRLVDVENLSEEELQIIRAYYQKLHDLAKTENSLLVSHSIDEARKQHETKKQNKSKTKKPFYKKPKPKNNNIIKSTE